MKKVAFIMVGLLAILFVGCGEGTSTASSNGVENGTIEVITTVDASVSEETTPKTPYNLSNTLGTPPGLPSE